MQRLDSGNAPDVACTTHAQCPACPTINGMATACHRQCEAHMLKMYDNGGNADMTDLFLDPDEADLRGAESGGIGKVLSDESGPYGSTIRKLACCLDGWWAGEGNGDTLCGPADACPAQLTCNQ